MKYLKAEQLKPLLDAERTVPCPDLPSTENLRNAHFIGEWWDPNFRLMGEKNAAFRRELAERADRLNAGFWPFT